LTGTRWRAPRVTLREHGAPATEVGHMEIAAPDRCPHYCGRVVRGVTVGSSPFWMRLRLRRSGLRPINNVVDATNYVMVERGQPLHAFDLERIPEGRVVVRCAATGERLVTLDGVERTLAADDLVIAGPREAIAVAGVMGGQETEVTAATRVLLIESAFFAPASVRRTSRRLGLGSQASYRFERRVDPAGVGPACDVAAALCARLGRGHVAPGRPGAGAAAVGGSAPAGPGWVSPRRRCVCAPRGLRRSSAQASPGARSRVACVRSGSRVAARVTPSSPSRHRTAAICAKRWISSRRWRGSVATRAFR